MQAKLYNKESNNEMGPRNRHNGFQLGTNPMEMTKFEKELVRKEKEERRVARDKYVAGIQGRDGGCFPRQQFENEWPDKF